MHAWLCFHRADPVLPCYNYLQMLKLSKEAIGRIYIACTDSDCFRRDLPRVQRDVNVSMHSNLACLRLHNNRMLPSAAELPRATNAAPEVAQEAITLAHRHLQNLTKTWTAPASPPLTPERHSIYHLCSPFHTTPQR